MADDDNKPTNAQAASKSASANAGDGRKVTLLAKFYMQRVPDTSPIRYRRFKKGDVLTVTDDEFAIGNDFKPSFAEVD